MTEYQVAPFVTEHAAIEGDSGSFSGYASTFNRDANGDRILPGAFAESIVETRGKVPILMHHSPDAIIGFSSALAEDHKGLAFTGRLALDAAGGRDAMALLKLAKELDYRLGLSIGFQSQQWEYEGDIRTLSKVKLWEVSLTGFPANDRAFVTEVKSIRELEQRLRDVGGYSVAEAKKIASLVTAAQSPTPARDVQDTGQTLRNMAQLTKEIKALCL